MYKISTYVHVKDGSIYRNNQKILASENVGFKSFSKHAYQQLNLQYPKFHKMDNLCKLAFLTSEIVLSGNEDSDIALVFCNEESSLDTDMDHLRRIQQADDYYPSPAVFVYTLPNISIGEVSIRHQLKSESAFLLADSFQIPYIHSYSEYLLTNKKANKVLCGWMKMLKEDYEACFYLVESDGELAHNRTTIEQIINTL